MADWYGFCRNSVQDYNHKTPSSKLANRLKFMSGNDE
ncbi:hypothetical protein FOYG_11278 [Fusarium oxysporum NRRL 32931]|uniref:Uncharacterized protein n=1 Tax=Fusarium oxysporum NRRL 32931 TaxID=660029 RepID=W9I1V8_FUSOX|nr:hypothetical protein FOYG_11278 [Fusarium oxysporum NRRL 32931]